MTKTKTDAKAKMRRRLKFEGIVGGIAEASIKSLTRDDGTVHHPRAWLDSGEVFCTCEQFHFRLAKHEPTLANPDLWCKHLNRHVAALMRRGEIADRYLQLWLRPCIGCGVVDAENAIAPDGHHVTGYVCNACESAWLREENAGAPAPLCPCCCYPENVCEMLNHLMASAPDLLEALKMSDAEITRMCESKMSSNRVGNDLLAIQRKIRAAIAKAKGEDQCN